MSGAPPDSLRPVGGWSVPIAALLLAAWLGAALYFSVVVTRAAFAVLPTRALSGALVGQTLPILYDTGLIVGLWLAATALLTPRGAVRAWSLIGGLAIAVLAAAARFVILPRIARLRLSLPAVVESLPPDDPARRAFGQLHALSVGVLGLSMLIGIVVAIVLAYSLAATSHD
jgi:hypothetical protein